MRTKQVLAAAAVVLMLAGCGGAPKQGATGTQTPANNYQKSTSPSSTPAPAPSKAAPAKQWASPPPLTIDSNKEYFATIKTSLGDIRIQLFAKDAPKTVNNFVFLAQQHFYEGVVFHRIIKDFMIQTGDPTGTGAGGPGYQFADELPPKHPYGPGIVAMANAGPNTNGSQFFICTVASAGLDQHPFYTQFGQVVAGMDVVQKIASVPVVMGNGGDTTPSKPKDPPVIQSVTIEVK